MSLSHWTNFSFVEMVNGKRQVNEITWSLGKKWCLPFALKMAREAFLNKPSTEGGLTLKMRLWNSR